jgi:hypothetical protein
VSKLGDCDFESNPKNAIRLFCSVKLGFAIRMNTPKCKMEYLISEPGVTDGIIITPIFCAIRCFASRDEQ